MNTEKDAREDRRIKNKSELTRNKPLDIAAFVSLGGVGLYACGWVYLRAYYAYFNVPSELLEFGFDQILSTTWWVGVLIFIGLTVYQGPNKTRELSISMISVSSVLSIIILLLIFDTYGDGWDWRKILVIAVVWLVLGRVITRVAGTKRIRIDHILFGGPRIERLRNTVLLFVVLSAIYGAVGYSHALQVMKNSGNISMTLQMSDSPGEKAWRIIGRLAGKLVLVDPVRWDSGKEVTIVKEENINHIVVAQRVGKINSSDEQKPKQTPYVPVVPK